MPRAGRVTRRLVTVLFADLVGSTELGERIDPEVLRGVMAAYLSTMRAVVEGHLGTTERLIGDSVMAVFGARRAREDDALRAVRAAAEMLEALAGLNADTRATVGADLQMRIGVNTGEVVTGPADAAVALGDVLGDAVNVAARLQSAARPDEIVIGGLTRTLVRGWVEGEPVALVVKGKSVPVQAFRLARVAPLGRPMAPASSTAMVGRTPELRQLRSAFEAAAAGAGTRLVTVLGEAGVGKSRLLWEFTRSLPPGTVLSTRCLPYGTALTYWPLLEITRLEFGAATDLEALRAATRRLLSADADTVAGLLGAAMGLTSLPASPVEIAWASRQLLVALAAQQPRVVVIDDIQWADPTFLDLVESLTSQAGGARLLVVCMARPELLEERPDWPIDIRLEPLETEAIEHLVGALIPGDERVAALVERIAHVAGGHPLFAEELVTMLVEQGTLMRTDDAWRVASEVGELELPATIDSILATRIDQLEPAERDVIEATSVIGQTFGIRLVQPLIPDIARSAVESLIAALEARRLVVRTHESAGTASEELGFAHLLIRDAVYRAVPKARRAELHERLADFLSSELAPELEEIVAHHFAQASAYLRELGLDHVKASELGARAGALYLAAGTRATGRGDRQAGSALLRQAAALTPRGHPLRAQVLVELGCAIAYAAQPRTGIETLTEAVAAAREQGDLASEWRARLNIAMARTGTDPEGSTDALFEVADEAEARFATSQDPRVLAEIWRARAAAHHMHSDETARIAALDRATAYDEMAGDANAWQRHAIEIATAMLFGPTPAQDAIRRIEAMLPQATPQIAMSLHAVYATLAAMVRDVELADRHAALASAIGGELRVAGSSSFGAAIRADLGGDHERAVTLLDKVARECEEVDDLSALAGTLALSATQLVALGRDDEALAAIRRCDELTASDDHINFVWSRTALALVHARRAEWPAAEAAAREALDHARETDAALDTGDAFVALARALAGRRQIGAARAAADHARDIYRAKQAYARLPEVESLLTTLVAETPAHLRS